MPELSNQVALVTGASRGVGKGVALGLAHAGAKVFAILTDGGGTIRQLQHDDPPVAGRVDDYLVALRAGSIYTLRLPLNRYSSPATKEYRLKLTPGHYRIEARFTGWDAESINLDTTGIGLLNFWKGAVRSNVVDLWFD